jgi:hypothetical protein
MNKWLEGISTGGFLASYAHDPVSTLMALHQLEALKTGGESFMVYRRASPDCPVKDFETLLSHMGGVQFFDNTTARAEGSPYTFYRLLRGVAIMNKFTAGDLEVRYIGSSRQEAETIRDFLAAHLHYQKEKGAVYAIIQSPTGFSVQHIGVAGEDLLESNYSADVVTRFKHVVEDLESKDPCGRLVLLDGPPGTGKTYLVRALLKSASNANFLVVPPQLVSELSGPQLVSCISSVRQAPSAGTGPTVLIIEDGEKVLMPRMSDNSASISSMLNVCDGIFGSLMDLRVIVTTNEKREDIDAALVRSGRLCRSIHVGLLSSYQAAKVYEQLTGKSLGQLARQPIPLSDIYRLARDEGWKPEARKSTNSMGFKADVWEPPLTLQQSHTR